MPGMKLHDIFEALLCFDALGSKQLCDAGHEITNIISWMNSFDFMPKFKQLCDAGHETT